MVYASDNVLYQKRTEGQSVKLRPNQIEAIGVALILIAAIWEATILKLALSGAARGPIVAVNEELKLIWGGIGQIQNPSEFVAKNMHSFYSWANLIDDPHADKVWLTGPLSAVRLVLFTLGSFATFYGKWTAGSSK